MTTTPEEPLGDDEMTTGSAPQPVRTVDADATDADADASDADADGADADASDADADSTDA